MCLLRFFLLILLALCTSVSLAATDVFLGSYIKTDAIFTRYSRGLLAYSSSLKNIGNVTLIPVNDSAGASLGEFDILAMQSRLWFRGVDLLQKFQFHIEIDSLNFDSTTEKKINDFEPAFQHAYFRYGDVLVGRTWSTCINLSSMPETNDFQAASSGCIFIRQPVLWLYWRKFEAALENPVTTFFNTTPAITTSLRSIFTDIILKCKHECPSYKISFQFFRRKLDVIEIPKQINSLESRWVWAIVSAEKLNIVRDNNIRKYNLPELLFHVRN